MNSDKRVVGWWLLVLVVAALFVFFFIANDRETEQNQKDFQVYFGHPYPSTDMEWEVVSLSVWGTINKTNQDALEKNKLVHDLRLKMAEEAEGLLQVSEADARELKKQRNVANQQLNEYVIKLRRECELAKPITFDEVVHRWKGSCLDQ